MSNMRNRKQWRDLSAAQRAATIVGGMIQMALLAWAVNDIRKRPEHELRGPKALWYAVSAINFIGPITYALAGRKRA